MHNPLHPVAGEISLKRIDPDEKGDFDGRSEGKEATQELLEKLFDLHYLMYAENKRALLVIFQGIDASGKDGAIRHLGRGLNPIGTRTHSFNRPSLEELDHDYLWRIHKAVPGRGEVALFSRSHYEEVTTVKVHPEYLDNQQLPPEVHSRDDLFKQRYRQISDFERMLKENGIEVIKFLLHISKKEQQERFEKRLENPKKHWKFSEQDLEERKLWDDYMQSFEKMIEYTSTKWAPWYVIPADHKWYRDYLVARIMVKTLDELKMKFPTRGIS